MNLKHFTFKNKKSLKERFADVIALIVKTLVLIVIEIFSVVFDFLNLILSLIVKFRKGLWRITAYTAVIGFLFVNFQNFAEAPKGVHAYFLDPKVISEHQQIYDYISEVFGKDSDRAFQLLSCENKSLNPNAVNDNTTWGGRGQDIGVFQINNSWQKVQDKFLFNWKINIEIAHQLYTENHNHFNLWTCGKRMGL